MVAQERPYEAPWTQRALSVFVTSATGLICRTFLYGLNNTEAHGLDGFLNILERRKDETRRERGLVTVSNHVSVLDDPMIWGVLPFRYHWNPNNLRWSLGSYDICFKNGQSSILSSFFTHGNTLPTRRLAHSANGGLFQSTITQAIRLLSDPHKSDSFKHLECQTRDYENFPPSDPFSSSELTYTTDGFDSYPAPSVYPIRRFSWVHIFPEGMIHQHPGKAMRYFKWGVARLILEAEPCPDVLPMWIDGPQWVMNEKRTWPRFVPRAGKEISVTFGDLVDRKAVFEPFRERWRILKQRARRKRQVFTQGGGDAEDQVQEQLGEVLDNDLRYGSEVEQLRIEVTLAVRNEVLKVRKSCGLSDEDPKRSLAATFRREGPKSEGEMQDRSVVKEM